MDLNLWQNTGSPKLPGRLSSCRAAGMQRVWGHAAFCDPHQFRQQHDGWQLQRVTPDQGHVLRANLCHPPFWKAAGANLAPHQGPDVRMPFIRSDARHDLVNCRSLTLDHLDETAIAKGKTARQIQRDIPAPCRRADGPSSVSLSFGLNLRLAYIEQLNEAHGTDPSFVCFFAQSRIAISIILIVHG
jgi:hypothetical protein